MATRIPNPNLGLRFSNRGRDLLKYQEQGPLKNRGPGGFAPNWYRDGAGVLTIGWGHARKATDKIKAPLTQAGAEAVLAEDIAVPEIFVRASFGLVTLTQDQFDALVMFAFNLGVRALEKSTLRKRAMAGDHRGAAAQFLVWNKFRNPNTNQLEVADGLVIRRTVESMLYAGETTENIVRVRTQLEARAARGSLA